MRLIDLIRRLFGGGPTPVPVPPPRPAPATDLPARLLAAVNLARRTLAAAAPLAADPALGNTAAGWAAELAARGGPADHGNWFARLSAARPDRPVSEDIAAGQRSPEQAVADWLADPPHRASVLNPLYTAAGCGVSTHPGGWTYYVIDLGG